MAHRSRLAGFIIDCRTDDLDAAATFWGHALGIRPSAHEQEGGAEYIAFDGTPGDLHVEVQKVAHPSRVHLDIESDDIDAEADRLEALGARRIGFVKRWWVMEAPTGQRFCVIHMRESARREAANAWD